MSGATFKHTRRGHTCLAAKRSQSAQIVPQMRSGPISANSEAMYAFYKSHREAYTALVHLVCCVNFAVYLCIAEIQLPFG